MEDESAYSELRRFLMDGLPALGALAELPRRDLVELLLPDDMATSLGVPGLLRLALTPEMAKENADAIYLAYGSDLLDRLIALVRTGDHVGRWYVTGVTHPVKNLHEELARRVLFPNARVDPTLQAEEVCYHYAAAFWFRVIYLSHERREALHGIALDLHTHQRVDLVRLLRQNLDPEGNPTTSVAPFWAPAAGPPPTDLAAALAGVQDRAAVLLQDDLAETLSAISQRAARRLEEAQARLGTFYDDVLKGLERRKQRAEDEERESALATKMEAVTAERQKKLAEAEEQHRLRVTLRLVAAALIARPMTTTRVQLENRFARVWLPIAWDPVARDLSLPACQVCGRPTDRLYLCACGHLACADDALHCSACSRVLCRSCGVAACIVCKRPLCARHQVVCATCGQVTCQDHQRACHQLPSAPAEPPRPAPKAEDAKPAPSKTEKSPQPKPTSLKAARAAPRPAPLPEPAPEPFARTPGYRESFPNEVAGHVAWFLLNRPSDPESLALGKGPLAEAISAATSWEALQRLIPRLTGPYYHLWARQFAGLGPEAIARVLRDMDRTDDTRTLSAVCMGFVSLDKAALPALLATLPTASITNRALMQVVLGLWEPARGVPEVGEELWRFHEVVKDYRKGLNAELHLAALVAMAHWQHPRVEEALAHVLEGKPNADLLDAFRLMAYVGKATLAAALARFLLRSPGDWETPALYALAYIVRRHGQAVLAAVPEAQPLSVRLAEIVPLAHRYWT